MVSLINKNCEWCKTDIIVRLADHKRGWGRFCSKSCKAKSQEKKNGQHSAFLNGRGVSNLHPERLKDYFDDDDTHPFSPDGLGQWID